MCSQSKSLGNKKSLHLEAFLRLGHALDNHELL